MRANREFSQQRRIACIQTACLAKALASHLHARVSDVCVSKRVRCRRARTDAIVKHSHRTLKARSKQRQRTQSKRAHAEISIVEVNTSNDCVTQRHLVIVTNARCSLRGGAHDQTESSSARSAAFISPSKLTSPIPVPSLQRLSNIARSSAFTTPSPLRSAGAPDSQSVKAS